MFLNFSNHPSSTWQKKQLEEAAVFGEIVDLAFPIINPESNLDVLSGLADQYCAKILKLQPKAVHIMGEMVFTFTLVQLLKKQGVFCMASTSKRQTIEKDGVKTSIFEFVQFRPYF